MKRAACIISVASALIWVAAAAQGPIEQTIMQHERDLSNAYVKADTAVVQRLEAENYTFTAPDGSVTGRTDDLDDLKTGNFKVEAIDLNDLNVRVYGSAAVVNGNLTLKNGKWRGKDISGDYRFTDVWAKVNGNWQLVAGQSTLMAQR